MLKPLLFVSASILFGVTALSAPAPRPQDAAPAPAAGQKNPVKPTEKSQARAKEIYAVDCAICHGENGNGKTDLAKDMQLTLGDWTDARTLANKSDDELFKAIRNGKESIDLAALQDPQWQGQDAPRGFGTRQGRRGLEPDPLHSRHVQGATAARPGARARVNQLGARATRSSAGARGFAGCGFTPCGTAGWS